LQPPQQQPQQQLKPNDSILSTMDKDGQASLKSLEAVAPPQQPTKEQNLDEMKARFSKIMAKFE
jgi:tagatose-1,6-bisphosphate aldolase